MPGLASHFDLNLDTGGELELHEGVDSLGIAVIDVEEPAVGIKLKLLAGLLVNEGRAVDCEDLLVGGKRNGTVYLSTGSLHGVHDLGG